MREPVDSRASADLSLAIYLEPLIEDRHVLLIGSAHGALAERCDARAARLDIIDPVAREPSRGPVPELPFRDATFDLVLVCDVAALPDPRPDAVRELRRVLSDDGVIALCTVSQAKKRRRSGPPGEMLDKLLTPQFRYVRVLGQAPLSGYGLGPLGQNGADEFAIDSSLMRGDREFPERYVALGSDARFELEPRLWVQVPVREGTGDEGEHAVALELVRKLEDEARDASQREAEAVRELENERRARADAEHKAERARGLERRLRDAEADYDDAVARLRFLEREVSERDSSLDIERKHRESVEQELGREKAQVLAADSRVRAAEADRDAARADADAATQELAEVEKRLVERGEQVQDLERQRKDKEILARDLLEELRRLEQHKTADVEHDARVAELEAERDRAVQRALEAEVAREAAQMRADELRAQQLAEPVTAPPLASSGDRALDAELEGTLLGLRMRVSELEQRLLESAERSAPDTEPPMSMDSSAGMDIQAAELLRLQTSVAYLEQRLVDADRALAEAHADLDRIENMPQPRLQSVPPVNRSLEDADRGERRGLVLRLRETEAALTALRDRSTVQSIDVDAILAAERARNEASNAQTESKLRETEARATELERELEEADRFAEAHAEDGERISALEFELEAVRRRLDATEDDLRATEDALRAARAETEHTSLEASARLELAQRRETDARHERDAARAALEEARAMLAQLAGGHGVSEAAIRHDNES